MPIKLNPQKGIPELGVCNKGGVAVVESCGGFSASVEKNLATKPLLL